MKQEVNYIKQKLCNISIEEFDALDEVHEFSEKYKENKKEMLKEYRKNIYKPSKGKYKAAVAAVVLIISAPIVTNAATNGEFFNRIWGNSGKENIASHSEVIYDKEKGTSYTVTYPQKEYVGIELEKAEELIGDSVSYKPVVKKLGDTTLSVISVVYDGNAAVVEFTLEKKGGVDALEYSQLNNESKGAYFSDNADFYFDFEDCNGNIYVDLDKSTEDTLYCYNYMTMNSYNNGIKQLTLNTYKYPCTRGELYSASDKKYKKYMAETKTSSTSITANKEVQKIEFANKGGGFASISPLSLKIDMNTGLGLSEEEAYDPYNAYYVSVNYKDGTKYIVHEHEMEGLHSCDTETDNSSYSCGSTENNLTFVFNRLVDVDNVESVTVNETKYVLK